MTPKKTIACIDDVLSSTVNYDESLDYELSSYDFDWLEEARKALEMKTPKKPTEIQHIATSYDCSTKTATRLFRGRCPECNMINTNRRVGAETTYCEKCGHALDWSEKKDG